MSGENTNLKEIFNGIDGVTLREKHGGRFRFPLHLTQSIRDTSIESLELSVRATNSLRRAGYDCIGAFAESLVAGKELKSIRGCGAGTAREIMEKLFLFQYYSLKPEQRDRYLAEVVALNSSGDGSHTGYSD